MTNDNPVPDKQAAVIAGLLIMAMVFFGVVAKHDNPSWNKMIGQAKTALGMTKTKVVVKPGKKDDD